MREHQPRPDTLPLHATSEQVRCRYIAPGLASRAFLLAGYDMSPPDAIARALELGLIVVEETEGAV
ncbi:MAG TPA: hypothetical protein VL362_03680 [Patescibacteria group bacterium]|jgi:hypothetical protein|nr:hypothetical protein [Patescibacteria group bacterium]